MTSKNSEDLCRKCAKCCYEKAVIEDEVIITDIPCRYLDLKTNLCTVYEKRHDENIRCLTVEQGIEVRAFPDDCPYVKNISGYRGPLTIDEFTSDAEEKQEILRLIYDEAFGS